MKKTSGFFFSLLLLFLAVPVAAQDSIKYDIGFMHGFRVGVDVSRGLLLQAKERARGYDNVFVVQADADHLPFKQGFFSFVFAFTVLQNMPKPVETLKEIKQVAGLEASIVVTGLKRAVDLEVLGGWLEHAGLLAVSLRNDDALQCHVVVAVQA